MAVFGPETKPADRRGHRPAHLRVVPDARKSTETIEPQQVVDFPNLLPIEVPTRRQLAAEKVRGWWRRGKALPAAIGSTAVSKMYDMANPYHGRHERQRRNVAAFVMGVAAVGLASYVGWRLFGSGPHHANQLQTLTDLQNNQPKPSPSPIVQLPLPLTDVPSLPKVPDVSSLHANLPTHTPSGYAINYDTPWGWSTERVGAQNAMGELHRLGDVAMREGHHVSWITGGELPDGAGNAQILSIDGSTGQHVIDVLQQAAA